VGLRLELKDGNRTLAVYGKKDIVGRMLDAAEGTTSEEAAPAPKRKTKKRRALGRGAEPGAALVE
jgi:hypothetical protein